MQLELYNIDLAEENARLYSVVAQFEITTHSPFLLRHPEGPRFHQQAEGSPGTRSMGEGISMPTARLRGRSLSPPEERLRSG